MSRTTPRIDLTRWNRAGLSRVQYVDGNAAVFLEELRAGMIARFLRGVPASEDGRQTDFWFNLLSSPDHPAPAADKMQAYIDALDWNALADGLPVVPETRALRNGRLVENYNNISEDYAAEMMRAFARASHVLAGYVDAYVNEGYLATATQWPSLHRLGQMVNYAPAPPASAADTVALKVKEDTGVQVIRAGLAMSAPPPGGGAPLVFETLSDIVCHPDLNAARQRRWNVNRTVMTLSALNDWKLDGAKGPSPGAPVLIAPGKFTEPSPKVALVAQARLDVAADTMALSLQSEPGGTWRKGYTELWHEPDGTAKGLPVPGPGVRYFRTDGTANIEPGSIVQAQFPSGWIEEFVVSYAEGDRFGIYDPVANVEVRSVRPMAKYSIEQGYFDVDGYPAYAFFAVGTEVTAVAHEHDDVTGTLPRTGHLVDSQGNFVASRYASPAGATWGGMPDHSGDWTEVEEIQHPPRITDALNDPAAIIPFKGKPPKTLAGGSYYIARNPDDTLTALRVRGIRAEQDEYFIAFNKAPGGKNEDTLFIGPLKTVLRPVDHDRNVDTLPEADGWITLAGLSDEAKSLIRVGKKVILEDKRETGPGPVLATVEKVSEEPGNGGNEGERDQARIRLTSVESSFSTFVTGWTVFRFNTLPVSHGETKGGKTLGSGNGERVRQTLPLDVKSISFVADAKASTGMRPDIDVTVDGTLWDYADLTDPTAEDMASYSIRPRDDGTLDIVFRRRLPSGKNNIRVSRHRVGAGRVGNGIGPYALTKPKSKHKIVDTVFQPFSTAGGADRESTSSIRENAGAAIAANERAVSLEDFSRLVRRHSGIWDARAAAVLQPGRTDTVDITVVPVDGAMLNDTLSDGLKAYLSARALPGTHTTISDFTRLPLTLSASVRADTTQHPEDELREICETALAETFSLEARRLGRHFFVAEVLATLETIPGVETASAAVVVKAGTTVAEDRLFVSSTGAIRAVYPRAHEVAFVAGVVDVTIEIESLP